MKALTLWQPWAHAIAHLGKRIENRTWAPPRSAIGQSLAIHAGRMLDVGALEVFYAERLLPLNRGPVEITRGAVIAVASLESVIRRASDVPDGQGYWWNGPIGWLLVDVVAIDPVPCRGAQGLWDLPADVEETVLKRCER